MKLGLEVEGRLKGLPTLFMSADEFLGYSRSGLEHKLAKERPEVWLEWMQTVALYVSDPNCEVRWDCGAFVEWAASMALITLEVRAVEARVRFPPNVTIMLRIDEEGRSLGSSFWELYDSDQIKFSDPERGVYCCTKGSMVRTLREEFNEDILV